MNLNLGEHFETMVRDKVKSGRYTNASEVVRQALREMEIRDRNLARLREAVAEGKADVAAGRVFDWTETTLDEIQAEADEADRLGLPIDGYDLA